MTNGKDRDPSMLYIGTYTTGLSQGIYGFRFHSRDSSLTSLGLMAATTNPSFLLHNSGSNTLYTTCETSTYNGQSSGSLRAYRSDSHSGQLTLLNEVASLGTSPCFLSFDRTRRFLFAANFFGGSVACFAIEKDGQLGTSTAFIQHHGSSVHPERQTKPHPHSILVTPDNRHALAADLGTDKILIYRFDERSGSLTPAQRAFISLAPGSGPRHMAFHPNGHFLFVINEISSTVTVFSLDESFLPTNALQTLPTTPPGYSGEGDAAELLLSPDGKTLYTTTRRSGNISIFRIDRASGHLTLQENMPSYGKSPFTCAFDPSERWLLVANQASSDLSIFHSKGQGKLEFHRQQTLPDPASFCFV